MGKLLIIFIIFFIVIALFWLWAGGVSPDDFALDPSACYMCRISFVATLIIGACISVFLSIQMVHLKPVINDFAHTVEDKEITAIEIDKYFVEKNSGILKSVTYIDANSKETTIKCRITNVEIRDSKDNNYHLSFIYDEQGSIDLFHSLSGIIVYIPESKNL